MNWIQLIKEVGPFLGIMFFFIWRDYRREEALVKQVDNMHAESNKLNEWIRTDMMNTLDRNTEAYNRCGRRQCNDR